MWLRTLLEIESVLAEEVEELPLLDPSAAQSEAAGEWVGEGEVQSPSVPVDLPQHHLDGVTPEPPWGPPAA